MLQKTSTRDNSVYGYLRSVLLGSFVAIAFLMIVCVGGCNVLFYPNHVPELPPEKLVLADSDFPEAWTVTDVFTDRVGEDTLLSYDGAIVWLEHPHNPDISDLENLRPDGMQKVYSYRSLVEAHLDFVWQSDYWFKAEGYSEWYTSPDIGLPSTVADEYQFGCAIESNNDRTVCIMIARYGQYLSEFQIHPVGSDLSQRDFHNILTAIDQQFIEMGVKE